MRVAAGTLRLRSWWDGRFFGRWVAANTLAELLGLGTTGLLIATLAPQLDTALLAGLMVGSGAVLEGVLVGVLQSSALRTALPRISARSWTGATTLGAGVAWALGVMPSTLMDLGEGAAAATEPGALLVFGLAALLGLVLGPILATPQWWVLRQHVGRAGWWIGANALAWALGMPLIFVGIDLMMASGSLAIQVGLGALTLTLTGATVGAVHGLVLTWLVGRHRRRGRQMTTPGYA